MEDVDLEIASLQETGIIDVSVIKVQKENLGILLNVPYPVGIEDYVDISTSLEESLSGIKKADSGDVIKIPETANIGNEKIENEEKVARIQATGKAIPTAILGIHLINVTINAHLEVTSLLNIEGNLNEHV